MDQAFAEKIMPSRWFWCLVNNLDKFNDKPEYITNLIEKFKRIEDHRSLSMLRPIAEKLGEGYTERGVFPDVAWLKLNYKDNITIHVTNDEFSMQIYESLDKYLDQEYLKQELDKRIVMQENPNLEDFRDLIRDMVQFSDRAVDLPEETKESLINSYDRYSSNFRGIKTHIKPIDDIIGVLGYKSMSVFAAPSGHGKSTFAFSVAYYAALSGYCVDYLSFEVPQDHAWFNFVSMHSLESSDKKRHLKSSDMKENLLSEEEKEIFKDTMRDLLGRIKAADGYLNILDQTTTSVDTYEGLCAKLESIAEKRGRKADLIVVDNIDNFQILKSSERDEATKVNNYIVSLDGFSKKYYNGEGVSILLLSQVNRTGLKKLHSSGNTGEDGEKKVSIDVTCIQKFNALYEKATCVLVGFSNEVLRLSDTMQVFPVKLRNRAIPERPITLRVNFAHSRVMGDFALHNLVKDETNDKKKKEIMNEHLNNWMMEQAEGLSEDQVAELDDVSDLFE